MKVIDGQWHPAGRLCNYHTLIVNKNPALGPAPPEPTSPPPGASDEMVHVLGTAQGPLTVPELTDRLGVHPNTVRARLSALVDDGLVERTSLVPEGRGRPAHIYALSDQGRKASQPRDVFGEYRGLSAAFAEHLAQHSSRPAQEGRAVGRVWGAELAQSSRSPQGDVEPRVSAQNQTVDLLEELGFTPVPERTSVALRTCPLLELAIRLPEVVCAVHRGLVEGALREFSSRDEVPEVELAAFAEPGACRLYWS